MPEFSDHIDRSGRRWTITKVDITGWSEDEIQAWERQHHQFATDERADAAADTNEPTPKVIAESDWWAKYFSDEAEYA